MGTSLSRYIQVPPPPREHIVPYSINDLCGISLTCTKVGTFTIIGEIVPKDYTYPQEKTR